ncbi:MAG: hypothetical protein OEW06_02120 [Gemmatimonadota bacterium]|nr:hypothetical protein [Gemmatimonadota bacterium]
MTQPVPDQTPGDRRSGADRRVSVIPFPAERRRAADRRAGRDRRAMDLNTRDHLRLALEHVVQAADDAELDDETLRRVDNVLLRLWALLETPHS